MITLSREPNSTAEFVTEWTAPHPVDLNISVLPATDPALVVDTIWTGNAAVYCHVISGGQLDTTYTVQVSSQDHNHEQQVYKEAEQ
jgi:hypothetical protein